MPYTQESAMTLAGLAKTALATSKMRLFKSSFVPGPTSKLADFVAAEADYDGYTAGGVTVTAMNGPASDPAGGANIVSPLVFFTWVLDEDAVGNTIGGWFQTLTGGALFVYGTYPQPIAMAQAGDSIPQVASLNYGQNPVG